MEVLYFLLGLVILFGIWCIIFQYANANISTRIIKRGEGYAIQVRGKYKWNDVKGSDGTSLVFNNKVDAAEVLDLALSAYKKNKG